MAPRAVVAGTLAAALLAIAPAASGGERAAVVTVSAVGDIAMIASPDGGDGFFSPGIRRAIAADVALGNLEGTLTTRGVSKCRAGSSGCFAFRAPPSYARVLARAGFTIVNLANNHALDFGAVGQRETVAALNRARLAHTGRPGEVAYQRVRGVKVAVVGFAPYPWAQDLTDLPAARALVRRADRWADIVVATMHAGAEGREHANVRPGTEWYLGENRGNAVAFAHAVVDAGADLVVGHGPHVLRAVEWYRGRLIAYSLGNFLGNGTIEIGGVSGVSAVLRVRLRRNGSFVRGALVPVRLQPPGVPTLDRERFAHAIVRSLSREDFGRRGMLVAKTGRLRPPR